MNSKVETLDNDRIKVSVDVDQSDVDAAIARSYKDFSSKYSFPGFRKGKAPRPVVDNAVGKETVLASATEDLINDAYPEVIESERIFPVGSPDFGNPGLVESGKPFSFEFQIDVKPVSELSSYDPVEIEAPSTDVTDEEAEEQLDAVLDRYETFEVVDDASYDDKSYGVDLSIKATNDKGDELPSITSDNAFYLADTGIYSDAFGDELKGMKAGDTKTFSLEIDPEETSLLMADLAGQKVDFEVTCKDVKKSVRPDATDEWAKEALGFDSLDDLKENIKESISSQKESIVPQIKENAAAEVLVKRCKEDAPESMVEQIESELLQDFFTQLQRQGATFDQYLQSRGIDNNQFKEDVKKQAQDNAKRDLALDAWAAHFGIEATDEDVTLEFERAGLENPKETEDQWRKQGRLYMIREGIMRSKAMEDVLDKAKVKEIDIKEYANKQ